MTIGSTGRARGSISATCLSRESAASQRQLGLLWGAVAIAMLTMAMRADQLAQALPGCTFKALVGIPCPTCGVTRAALALSDFNVGDALRINPLATLLGMAFIAGGLIAGGSALRGRPLREPRWNLKPVERLGLLAVVVTNWAYLVFNGI